MRLPDDLRRIRDAADPRDIDALKIGALGGLAAGAFVAAPKIAAWWLAWTAVQISGLYALLGL